MVIDTCIKTVVESHNVLHGFLPGRGVETAIMDIKITQELESVDQDTLYLVLLDIRKEYDNLDRGRLLQTLTRYGAGLKLQCLLA